MLPGKGDGEGHKGQRRTPPNPVKGSLQEGVGPGWAEG